MRSTIALVTVLLVLLGGSCTALWKLSELRSELSSTKATLAEVKAANDNLRAFTEDLQQQVLKAHIISSTNRVKIQHVLFENKDWGSTAIPTGVTTELCKQLPCQ